MLRTRQDLFDRAFALYLPLLEKAARRYRSGEVPTRIDHVGFSCTMLEELFRPLWGIAPLLLERPMTIRIGGEQKDVPSFYGELMTEGTDPDSPRRFDRNVTDYDREVFANQAVTEMAGYLTAVRLARGIFWDILTKRQQDQIAGWIMKWSVCAIRHSWPNNHYWYPILCLEALRCLGYDCSETEEDIAQGFAVLDRLYVDHGWYSDGEFGRFDYYEAWAHHTYPMLWILISKGDRPDDRERRERYRRRTEEFLAFFSHYFDCDGGMCAYGRSVSYRFAAVGAYGLAAAAGCRIRYGLAKRVILRNISYFFDNSIPTADGVLPPGYLYEALPFVENYTSDGSAYCYTQGFLALFNKENSPLWQSREEELPIERGNFLVQCPADGIGVVLEGNRRSGITLYNNSVHYYQEQYFDRRFNDMAGYYSKFAYNSRSGYSISTRDMVSAENMISLGTPDGRMMSHRQAIETIATSKELLISGQIPFSNDPETRITTWLLPLADGYHVRIHRLCLSQSYRVTEGGFSIGLRDDGFTAEDGVICYGAQISAIDAELKRLTGEETIAIKKGSRAAHPGMHLLAPRSIYPCYETGVLPAGEYVSAVTVYYVTDGMMPENAPVITWNGTVISVTYGEIQRSVDVTAERNG